MRAAVRGGGAERGFCSGGGTAGRGARPAGPRGGAAAPARPGERSPPPWARPSEGNGAAAGGRGGDGEGSGAAARTPRPVRAARRRRRMCCWRGGMMLAGPQLVAGPAAPGGERARLLSLYVQDYLECVESLPLDIQRNASLLREMDTQCQGGRRRGAPDGRERGEKGTASNPPHMRPERRSRGRGETLLGPRGAEPAGAQGSRRPVGPGEGGPASRLAEPRCPALGPGSAVWGRSRPAPPPGQSCCPNRRRCRWRWGAEIGLPAAPPAVRSRGAASQRSPEPVPR